jgi:flavin-dependent dehydrogenase
MHEVIVVGAGPAGAVTARQLALRGVRPWLLEKAASLPRERACAGVVTPRLLERLERLELTPAEELVLNRLTRFSIAVPGGPAAAGEIAGGPLTVVRRDCFDQALVEAAVRAGARFELDWKVDAVERTEDGWRVQGERGALEARIVVLATGPRDTLAVPEAEAGSAAPPTGLGLTLDLEPSRATLEGQTVVLELGSLARGFLWLMPAGSGLCAGLLSTEVRHPEPRRRLHGFLERCGLGGAGVLASRSELLPGVRVQAPRDPPGLVRVGDRLGVGDPLTGLGLDAAVRSAVRAADAVARGLRRRRCDPARDLERAARGWWREQRIAARTAAVLHRSPARFVAALASRPARAHELTRCVLGLIGWRDLSHRGWPTAFDRFLRRLSR